MSFHHNLWIHNDARNPRLGDDPEDVAGVVLMACMQSPKSRLIEVRMRTMAEGLM